MGLILKHIFRKVDQKRYLGDTFDEKIRIVIREKKEVERAKREMKMNFMERYLLESDQELEEFRGQLKN